MELEKQFKYRMPESLKELFPNSTDFEFKIKKEYKECLASGQRPMAAIDHSISFYMDLVYTNAEDIYDAKMLIEELKDAIEYQVKQYTYCICKSSDSYLKWLIEEFKRRLTLQLTKEYNKYLLN
jgi:hypothetical protein